MGKLLSYSGTTTKIRAIKSRLLTRKDYETLAAMPTVTGALAYLKQKPSYEELFSGLDESTLHRSQVEQILTDRKSTRLNSSHWKQSRMPSSA